MTRKARMTRQRAFELLRLARSFEKEEGLMQQYFPYGQAQIAHLCACDAALGAVIEQVGPVCREVTPDLFTALLHSIVSQQISSRARDTIWARLTDRFVPFVPACLSQATQEEIQACGVSMRKAGYIKGIADAVASGGFDLSALHGMDDEQVCDALCVLPGVGRWTAEMLMIFSMMRPDVLSFGDLGIRRGMRMVYQREEITADFFEQCRRRFSPCATVAGLYFWAVAGGALPGLTDPGKAAGAARRNRG